MSHKSRIASQHDPMIAAVIGGFYRFTAKEDALATLATIAREFTQAKDKEPQREDGSPMLKMWVGDFEVTAAEKTGGYVGHFARMWVEFLPIGYHTLKAEKILTPLARHPQKSNIKGKHPNRDNPVMRAVERGKKFASIVEANALLEKMHLDYPLATIPAANALHIMLYSRPQNATGGGYSY